MKKIYIILISLAIALTTLNASAFSKDIKYRAYKVNITSEKTITTGFNEVKLNITKNGKKIKKAKVSIKAFMPAMPGMPAMSSKSEAVKNNDNTFTVKFNLPMRGTWQLHIFIKPEIGKKSRIKTSINI